MFDPTSDLEVCDGLESIELRCPGEAIGRTIAGTLRRMVRVAEAAASDGKYLAQDIDWHLPGDEQPAPQVGSEIVDAAGARFVVLTTDWSPLTQRWRCHCRKLEIVSGLDRVVTLQQGTWTKSASGVPVATWHDVRLNLPARIQPQQGDVHVELDRRTTRVTHRVYVAERLVVDHTHRLVAGAETYRILGYEQPEQLGACLVILTARTSAAVD